MNPTSVEALDYLPEVRPAEHLDGVLVEADDSCCLESWACTSCYGTFFKD